MRALSRSLLVVALLVGCAEPRHHFDPADASSAGDDASVEPVDASLAGSDAASADDAATTSRDAAATQATGMRIVVEPSDSGTGLVSAIAGASTSVHVTMYLLSSRDVIDALVARHRAGLDVRVVLNQTFPSGTTTSNDTTYATLTSAGIPVHWASSAFALTHEKCVIIDAREAWIMTMNATVTSPTANREFLAVDTDPVEVADAERIFEGDFAGTPLAAYTGTLVVAPLDATTRLHDLIAGATTTIDVEDEELSDRDTVSALVAAAGRGVVVHVVLSDGTRTSAGMTAVTNLRAAGIAVHTLASPYVHAKAIVVDGARAYVGSENLTYASLTANRELGVITSVASAVSVVASTIAADFSAGTAL